MIRMLIPLVGNTTFAEGWNQLWGKISAASGDLFNYLAMFGMALVVGAFGKWLWDRRRGNGGAGGGTGLLITIVIGALLASPTTIIPGLLTVADWLVALIDKLLP